MTGPVLVIVPAHPRRVIVPAHPRRAGDACRVEFEVRAQGDGRAVLPVFSSVAALVRALGRCQPWVCVRVRVAREAADRAGLIRVVIDPGVSSSGQRRHGLFQEDFGRLVNELAMLAGPVLTAPSPMPRRRAASSSTRP